MTRRGGKGVGSPGQSSGTAFTNALAIAESLGDLEDQLRAPSRDELIALILAQHA